MKRFKALSRTKRIVAVGLTVGLTLGLASAAFAFFTSTGTGTGSATVGSATAWHVTSSTSGGPMYPGPSTGDESVTVNIQNLGSGNQTLNQFVISVAKSDGTAWTSSTTNFPSENACSQADFALGGQASAGSYTVTHTVNPTLPDDLAPNATFTTTVKLHMLDTGVAQDNCQGLTTVPLYISAS